MDQQTPLHDEAGDGGADDWGVVDGNEVVVEAARLEPENADLAKRTAQVLCKADDCETLLKYTAELPEDIQNLPRLRLYRAFALANTGDADAAEALLRQGGQWIEVPDIQEGEVLLSDLWLQIQALRAEQSGQPFDPDAAVPPYELDFRMFVAH